MMIQSTELRVQNAEREMHLWRRIARQLYEALVDPEVTEDIRQDAIETYENYAFPEDDDE